MAEINIANELNKILTEYTDEIVEITNEVLKEAGKEAVKELKSSSPKRSGKYARGWSQKVEDRKLKTSVTVYNKPRYYITHLLENGHARRGGGRTVGKIEHIGPVNEKIQRNAIEKIKEKVARL